LSLDLHDLLVTCEHGGNGVPRTYARLFAGKRRLLESHRGWDPGALELGTRLSRYLEAPLVAATVTRLLVDLNRTLRRRTLFSEISRRLDGHARREVLRRYYTPHWWTVESLVAASVAHGHTLLHVASHSFTPILRGVRRTTDIGLLYDPRRKAESAFCDAVEEELYDIAPWLRVRRNYPYLGTAAGLTTSLRRRFPARHYLGLELEVSQRFVRNGGAVWLAVQTAIVGAFENALDRYALDRQGEVS
jgi:predicted N-formylglutamate amidohydrolase